jgi:NAD(P)H-hydrate epimerase
VAGYDLAIDELDGAFAGADVIVDALLGYGARGPARGEAARLIEAIGRSGRPVVNLDLPSGIDPDPGEAAGSAIVAPATLTLAPPKPGPLTPAGESRVGWLYLGDLGLPAAVFPGPRHLAASPFARGRLVRLAADP